ncbi:ferric reductase NAD binding domain-containing protein [Cladochytrium replicatum]|nr:ferric reductase NAD binding domain-containing protein [Cladochytrium replicatum]
MARDTPTAALLDGGGARKTASFGIRFANYFVNEGPKHIVTALWIAAQIAYYVISWIQLETSVELTGIRGIIKEGLPTARAAANLINLNCAILLFTVCRNLISMVRTTFLNKFIPFDKNITFHIVIAWCLVFWSYIHCVAHYFNYLRVEQALQPVVTSQLLSWWSGPGLSGQVITLAFFLMVTSAVESVRRKYFEIFWFTHHLFIVFFGGCLMHGAFCFIKSDPAPGRDICRGGPTFWKWWVLSAVAYLAERILREVRGRRKTYVSKVVQHPSKVVEVQIKKPSAKTEAGQYIFLCCPEIALYEWHPFTLTSSPNEDFISVHIRVAGDWTTAFAKRLGCRFGKEDKDLPPPTSLPFVMVDGPYGSASEDVFDFEASILVGAGIGVTPFASILKTVWYRLTTKELRRLKKVYFFWVCRDKDCFEWFQDLLMTLEEEDIDHFLEINTYLTAALKVDEMKNIIINDMEGTRDALTGLRSPTFYGRPAWDAIFQRIRKTHSGTDIGVFYCGPKALSGVLHKMSNKWSDSGMGTRFFYGKENF